jgi:hypothetical protein
MTPARILAAECRQAIEIFQPRLRWTIEFSHQIFDDLLNYIFNCEPQRLGKIPSLDILDIVAVDAGGVFTDSINAIFHQLIHNSGISFIWYQLIHNIDFFLVTMDPTTGLEQSITLAPLSDPLSHNRFKKQYVVFGRIFYWFVLIHKIIPYPISMDPVILAYAIHGEIPIRALSLLNPALYRLIRGISDIDTLCSNTELSDWLANTDLSISTFLSFTRRHNLQLAMRQLCNGVMIGNHMKQLQYIHEGFQCLAFISVSDPLLLLAYV